MIRLNHPIDPPPLPPSFMILCMNLILSCFFQFCYCTFLCIYVLVHLFICVHSFNMIIVIVTVIVIVVVVCVRRPQPNCSSRIVSAEGAKHIMIYAGKDILENQELVYDYKVGQQWYLCLVLFVREVERVGLVKIKRGEKKRKEKKKQMWDLVDCVINF